MVLLHTNDIHSHFERMPRIGEAIRRLRDKHAASEPIVIDGGDHMDRMRPETEGSGGAANVAVLNATGYDLVVPGNNEGLTLPPAQLAQAYEHRQAFAVVCGNLELPDTKEPPEWMERCRIFVRNGLRVGIIGVTAYYPDFYTLLGWRIIEPFEALRPLVEQVRPQVDILVVVSHLGINRDKAMAEEIRGIDIILGSHTHHLLEVPIVHEGVYIAATGCHGQYVGELEFAYDTDERKLRLVAGGCLRTEAFPPSPELERLIEREAQASRFRLDRTAATLSEPLSIDWGNESRLGNLLAAGLRSWTEAEIGIVNAGQILHSLEAGAVTQYRLLEICPSPINPCLVLLEGEQLRIALEEALLEEFIGKPIKGFGFRGKALGTLCLSGLRVDYDPDAAPYAKIRSIAVNGEPLGLTRQYKVGTIDMFTFGIGYLSLGRGETVSYYLPEFIRDVLARQLGNEEELTRSMEPHWFTVR